MTEKIDFEAFRANTGGDLQMETTLLHLFLECAEEALANLQQPGQWQQQLHLLKGIVLNVGAYELAQATEVAQHVPPAERPAQLQTIQQQYLHIKQQIELYLQKM